LRLWQGEIADRDQQGDRGETGQWAAVGSMDRRGVGCLDRSMMTIMVMAVKQIVSEPSVQETPEQKPHDACFSKITTHLAMN
jgi:hypothetical protein